VRLLQRLLLQYLFSCYLELLGVIARLHLGHLGVDTWLERRLALRDNDLLRTARQLVYFDGKGAIVTYRLMTILDILHEAEISE